MSNIVIKQFENQNVRLDIDKDQKVWYHGGDVCDVLGYQNARKAIVDHCKQAGVTKRYVSSDSGRKQAYFIDQHNIIRLVLRSKLPSAERFEEWAINVIHEVLNTGSYSSDTGDRKALRQDVGRNYVMLCNVVHDEWIRTHDGEKPKAFAYSNEANMLNRIVFGKSHAEWKELNFQEAEKGLNQRSFATNYQLSLLDHLEKEDMVLMAAEFLYQERKLILEEKAKQFAKIAVYFDRKKALK